MKDVIKQTQQVMKNLGKFTGQKVPRASRQSPEGILRTKVWIGSILQTFNGGQIDVEVLYHGESERTGTIARWTKGSQVATEQTVAKMESKIPGSSLVYHWPIFNLLDPDVNKKYLEELFIKNMNHYSCHGMWKLSDVYINNIRHPASLPFKDNADLLFQRGDVDGFMAILMLLHEAYFNDKEELFVLLYQYALKAFPGACRHRYLRPHWKEMLLLLERLRFKSLYCAHLLMTRKDIIERQIFAEEHITLREARPRSNLDHRFIELEEPFIEAGFN
jgi:hypothetical protein